MSQGHLLEIALQIQHLPAGVCYAGLSIRDTPSPLPTAGSSTCLVPKTSPPAKPTALPGMCCLAEFCGPSNISQGRAILHA